MANTKVCIDTFQQGLNKQIGIHGCHSNGYTQGFSYQKNQQFARHLSICIGLKVNNNTMPLIGNHTVDTSNHVVLHECDTKLANQRWKYDEEVFICITLINWTFISIILLLFGHTQLQRITHVATGQCLSTDVYMLIIEPCDPDALSQKWIIQTYNEYQLSIQETAEQAIRINRDPN